MEYIRFKIYGVQRRDGDKAAPSQHPKKGVLVPIASLRAEFLKLKLPLPSRAPLLLPGGKELHVEFYYEDSQAIFDALDGNRAPALMKGSRYNTQKISK